MKTIIIAEAGVNHNGDLKLALNLVRAAAAAGADIVKFQTFKAHELTTAAAPKADYQTATTGYEGTQRDLIARLELSDSDHFTLIEECRRHNITFLSTGFDCDSIDRLVSFGIDRIKIPSGELTNYSLLECAARQNLPIILSTGMANLSEIEESIEVIETNGTDRSFITLLHCNTEYPTPMADVNLRAMLAIGQAFGTAVGYSDHTLGIEIPIAAVALGATVIEKHLTLDCSLPGPDHRASLEPDAFKQMVTAIRNIELALAGSGIKQVSPSERKNRVIARRSLVAKTVIQPGDVFSDANVTAKRPGHGISPMRWREVYGRAATRAFAVDEVICL